MDAISAGLRDSHRDGRYEKLAKSTVRWGYMFRNGTSRTRGILGCGFATIGVCRSAIVQAGPSGGWNRESLRSLFLRTTGSTAIMEPQ